MENVNSKLKNRSEKWLHWDQNPWKVGKDYKETFNHENIIFPTENNNNYDDKVKVQGILGLSD